MTKQPKTDADRANYRQNGFLRMILGLGLSLSVPMTVSAQLPVPLDETQSLTGEAWDQYVDQHTFASNHRGTAIAVWGSQIVDYHYDSDPYQSPEMLSDSDIYFVRTHDGGDSWSAPSILNSNASTDNGGDFDASIATDGDGTWITTWTSMDSFDGLLGGERDIFFSRSTDDGFTWSTAQPLNNLSAAGGGRDEKSKVIYLGDETWLVAWQSTDTLWGTIGSDQDLLFSKSYDNGRTWEAPRPIFAIAEIDETIERWVELGMSANGTLLLAFSRVLPEPYLPVQPMVARSVDFGATWSLPIPLLDAADLGDGFVSGLSVKSDLDGNWLIAWSARGHLHGSTDEDYDTFVVRSHDDGESWSSPTPLNNNAAFDSARDYGVKLANVGSGLWMSTWKIASYIGPHWDSDIAMAFSLDGGVTWSHPQRTNPENQREDNWCLDPNLFHLEDGRWLVTWHNRDEFGERAMHGSRFTLADCNLNGAIDADELANGQAEDCNVNGIPDDCEADTDADGVIDQCDQCEGEDDLVDLDGNGQPDCSEQSSNPDLTETNEENDTLDGEVTSPPEGDESTEPEGGSNCTDALCGAGCAMPMMLSLLFADPRRRKRRCSGKQ